MIIIKLAENLYKVITCKFINKKLTVKPIITRHFEVYKSMCKTKCPHYHELEKAIVYVGSEFCQKECRNNIQTNLEKNWVICKCDADLK